MKILFQGDSITDAGRDRSNPHDMGEGYPKYASAMIADAFPDIDFEFIDLGISGNRTDDLVSRLESDFIAIDPDIISILIGINDVWHVYLSGREMPDDQFEKNYRQVLMAIKERTHAKIIMLEPFLIYTADKAHMRDDLGRKIEIERALAREFADIYVPLDGYFAAACIDQEPAFFSDDGIHPNSNGACFIGERYLEAIAKLLPKSEKE